MGKRIFITAVLIRITALLFILVYNNGNIGGYNSQSYLSDDVRYELGAIHYASNARNIFDLEAFRSAFLKYNDYTGYARGFSFWYWFVCVITYTFKSSIVLRLLNMCFGALTALYVFRLSNYIFDRKTAKLAGYFYAVNPYFVFFSIFLYKDQLLALITVVAFYHLYKYARERNVLSLLTVVLSLLIFASMRSGYVVLIAVVFYMLFRKERNLSLIPYRPKDIILYFINEGFKICIF